MSSDQPGGNKSTKIIKKFFKEAKKQQRLNQAKIRIRSKIIPNKLASSNQKSTRTHNLNYKNNTTTIKVPLFKLKAQKMSKQRIKLNKHHESSSTKSNTQSLSKNYSSKFLPQKVEKWDDVREKSLPKHNINSIDVMTPTRF